MLRFILILLLPSMLMATGKPAWLLYDAEGNPAAYEAMTQKAGQSSVVLFGELHNNPIAHWLQLELTSDLFQIAGEKLTLGAEMFESDNQLILNEYLSGKILERHFTAEAKLWNNYKTDYRPLVEFARENQLGFVATNIPRRYAAMVHRGGFEALHSLDQEALGFIAPLPIAYDPDLPAYKAMLEMTGMPAHGSENFPKAQAIKDATMAHFIFQNLNPNGLFIHYHGAYHSDNYEGIAWYLRQLDPDWRILTITTVEQDDIRQLSQEYLGRADFIIVVPSRMTKTY